MRRGTLIMGLATLIASATLSVASAAWNPDAAGHGTAKAKTMPTGATPTTAVSGRDVTVSWQASTFAGGGAIQGYTVKRYSTGGAPQSIGADCSGTISGTSCTERAVPSGDWRFSITPKHQGWSGTESGQSGAATVGTPNLSLISSSTIAALPATLNATIANFASAQTVAFRLDNPATGPVLSGSINPSPVPASGSASVSVTVPAGTSNGPHTIYAVGSGADTASASVTVSVPTISASVIDKTTGCAPGYVKQGGSYQVYASATGSPSAVSANVSNVTSGAGALSLSAGSYTAGGVSYGYRSAVQAVNPLLGAGSYSYTVTPLGGIAFAGSVTVDNTPPSASDFQATNRPGGIAGRPETGDSVTFTYNDTIDPCSILAGWLSGTANAVVRINQSASADVLTVWNAANTAQLPLGSVVLNNVVSGNSTFGATGTASSMTQSGGAFTIVLGTASSGPRTDSLTLPNIWTPSSSAFDRAGNAASILPATEGGSLDLDF